MSGYVVVVAIVKAICSPNTEARVMHAGGSGQPTAESPSLVEG